MGRGNPGSRDAPFSTTRMPWIPTARVVLRLNSLTHTHPPLPIPVPEGMRGGRCLRPGALRHCRLPPRSALHLLPCPRDQEAAPIPRAAQPAGCNLSPPLRTPASSGTLEKLCPLRTQVGKLHPGLRGDKRDGSRNKPLPGAVARERPEPWPGAVPAACRGLHTGQRRQERGSRSPAAHAPPLRWSHRGAESPLPARPPRPQLGPPPLRAPRFPPAHLRPAGLAATSSSHGRARHRLQEET